MQTLTLKPDVEGGGRLALGGRELNADALALAQQALEGDAFGVKGVIEKSGLVGQPAVDHHPGRGKGGGPLRGVLGSRTHSSRREVQ